MGARFGSRIRKALIKRSSRFGRVSKDLEAKSPAATILKNQDGAIANVDNFPSVVLDTAVISDRSLFVNQMFDVDIQKPEDDDNFSLEAMASPSYLSKSNEIEAISSSWSDSGKSRLSRTDLDNAFEWEELDDYVSSVSARLPAFRCTLPSCPSGISDEHYIPKKHIQSDRRVRFLSPVSTCRSFDSSSARLEASPSTVAEPTARTFSPIRAIEYIHSSSVSSNELSPLGGMKSLDTREIWRQETAESLAPKIDSEPEEETYELLRITFTPSFDFGDSYDCKNPKWPDNAENYEYDSPSHSEDSGDFYHCDSPVAAQPSCLSPEDTDAYLGIPSLPSAMHPKLHLLHKPLLQQQQWYSLFNIFTILLHTLINKPLI